VAKTDPMVLAERMTIIEKSSYEAQIAFTAVRAERCLKVDSADSPRGLRNKAGQELVVSATGESHEEARADGKCVVLERHAGICGRLASRCLPSLPNQLLPRYRMLASWLRPPCRGLCSCFARRYTAPRLPRGTAPMRGV
jgi:hypothetical protein